MGESFIGLPNRFNIIGRTKGNPDSNISDLRIDLENESIFKPHHILSAYYGYRLATEYVCRDGGSRFKMNGPFYSRNIIPVNTGTNNTITMYTVGDENNKFSSVWAQTFHGALSGNASTATKLETKRTIKVTLEQDDESPYNNSGSSEFDGSKNINIKVSAPYLHLQNGGTVKGDTNIYGTLTTKTILPKTLTGNTQPSIGNRDNKYNKVWASTFEGDLSGNATSSSKWANKMTLRTNVIFDDSNAAANYTKGYVTFDGSSSTMYMSATISENEIKKKFMSLTGGTITSSFVINSVSRINGEPVTRQSLQIPANVTNYRDGAVRIANAYGNSGRSIDLHCDDIACNRISASSVITGPPTSENKNESNIVLLAKYVKIRGLSDASIGSGESSEGSDTGYLKCDAIDTNEIYAISPNGPIKFGSKSKFLNTVVFTENVKMKDEIIHQSDIRRKHNIISINRCRSVSAISKLNPVEFSWISDDKNKPHQGLIAQQVKNVYKSKSICDTDDDTNTMSVNYIGIIPDLINVCQYLLAKVDALEVNAGIKDSLEFPELQKENTFDEAYYREHAEEIALA